MRSDNEVEKFDKIKKYIRFTKINIPRELEISSLLATPI
jgi:hypothetical protein